MIIYNKKIIIGIGYTKGGDNMNCGFNYSGCGCNSYSPFVTNPFSCCGCSNMSNCGCGYSNFGSTNWFAIVLVVFLLLIICGNSKIRVG